jgi:hypothetical protein
MDDKKDEGFARPEGVEWDLFEEAAEKLYQDWDITQHALDDEWAGGLTEEYCDRVLDHLLANFAERWLQGRGTKMHAVADFLTETIDDHFEVEIPHSIALPLAKVLTTLQDECRTGVVTGVTHILGKERVERVIARSKEPVEEAKAAPTSLKGSEGEEVAGSASPADVKTESDQKMPADKTAGGSADESAQEGATAVMEAQAKTQDAEDGWTTVGKKKGKKKGKQFE